VGEGAKRLGEKLLVEVEVENLSSVGVLLPRQWQNTITDLYSGTKVSS
jgi:hypothetical protein